MGHCSTVGALQIVACQRGTWVVTTGGQPKHKQSAPPAAAPCGPLQPPLQMRPPSPAAAPRETAVEAPRGVPLPDVLEDLLMPPPPPPPKPAAADAWMTAVLAMQTSSSAVLLQGLLRIRRLLSEAPALTSPACLLTPLMQVMSPSVSTAASQSASNLPAACV